MKPAGFAVIGIGMIGDLHLRALAEVEHARIVAVCSRTETKVKEVATQYQCDYATNYNDLLQREDVEAVCLTTGSGSHYPIGLDVLKAGKHLLVEKPIAMTTVQADELIRTARENQVTLGVISQSRFSKQHELIHRVVSEGKLGKLLLIQVERPFYRTQEYYDSADWRGTLAEDGGALMNQGIHSLDLMLWLGGEVERVSGKIDTQIHTMEAEDIGMAWLKFKNGAYGTVMSSTNLLPGYAPLLNVYGEKGSIRLSGSKITDWSVPDFDLPPELADLNLSSGASDPSAVPVTDHCAQITDFIEAFRTGKEPAITGIDGRNAVNLIEMIYESSKIGAEVINRT